jgi:hypothetical protein
MSQSPRWAIATSFPARLRRFFMRIDIARTRLRHTGPDGREPAMPPHRGISVVLGMTAAVLGLGSSSVLATNLPADTSVFGKRPAMFRNGVTPFPASGSIWQFQQDADDPITRLKFFAVPGLRNGLGRFTWRLASLGKYIVLGNGQTMSIGGDATDLRVGIFNSETKQYCDLIIDPTLPSQAAQIVTANPGARQSRILLAPGTGWTAGIGDAAAFGFIAADLDAPDPCAWPTVMVSAAELNAGLPAADQICPDGVCAFDTLGLLGHDDVPGQPFGRDYVAIGEYFSKRNAVIRVDASGIAVVAAYQTKPFATPGSGGACYAAGAARLPSSDFRQPDTRPVNDWRFVFSYDAFLKQVYSTPPPASCAPAYPYCPKDLAADGAPGAACPTDGACDVPYCAEPFLGSYVPCSADADCHPFDTDLGPCQTACLQKSPLYQCRTSSDGGSHRQCLSGQATTCPTKGETCTAGIGIPTIVGPSQEYRFDKTTNTITPMSGMFFSASAATGLVGASPTGGHYASDRSVWVGTTGARGPDVGVYRAHASTDSCRVDGTTIHVLSGEHCYYDPTNPSTAVVVPPDQVMGFELTPMLPQEMQTLELGGVMYFADTGSLQYAQNYSGGWFTVDDTIYKTAFAYGPPYVPISNPSMSGALPAEPRRCSVSHLGCNATSDCPAGETCVATVEDGVPLLGQLKFLEAGGSPKSMWVSSGYAQPVPVAQTDVFLERVPLTTSPPANLSEVRPSIAWGGDRLWLVAEHDGELKYRVRDDGVWSTWQSLAPNNITPVGGAAVIANATTVRIYAHDAAGRVWEKVLSSGTGCAVGSCTWSSWTGLSSTVTTDMDVAATFADGLKYYVVVRNRLNQKISATYWNGSKWVSWFSVGNQTTDAAPAITYHPADFRVWIAIRQPGSPPQVKFIRVQNSNADKWNSVGGTPPATWGVAPAIVSDGSAVRVFEHGSAFPQSAWQIANDGSGWSGWRKTLAPSMGTRQPAAAHINGEVEIVTYWSNTGIQEALLP